MTDVLLATPEDAVRFGKGDLSTASLTTASARARGFTGQHISVLTRTIQGRGPTVRLPGRPVRSVSSVTANGRPTAFELLPGGLLNVGTSGPVTITYTSGWETVPEHVIEIIVTIAARLESLNPALAGGIQQATGGSESLGFGWDSHQGVGGLVTAEKDALRKLFPPRPGLIVGRQ